MSDDDKISHELHKKVVWTRGSGMRCPVTNKVRYATYEAAWADAVRLAPKGVRAYRCEFCGAYHLTTQHWEFPVDRQRRKQKHKL